VAGEQRYCDRVCAGVCGSLSQCVAVHCDVLQCVAVWQGNRDALNYVAACCSVLHYVAMCYSVLRYGKGTKVLCRVQNYTKKRVMLFQIQVVVLTRYFIFVDTVLRCVVACCNVLQYVAMC